MYPNKDFPFVQDSAQSHCANEVKNFLKQRLKSRFVKNTDWPPKSPDCNPLDYYFWDCVQEKVYDGCYCYSFATIDELKRRIRDVWDECARQSKETVSPPFGIRWRKRRRLNQNCFWIDINKQIYLLNTLWLFSFNQMKLDWKKNFEIIFWRQNCHFSRVWLLTSRN